MGKGKKNKKKETGAKTEESESATVVDTQPSTSAATEAAAPTSEESTVPPASQPAVQPEEEEDDGGGLGLGKSKNRKKKKPKPVAAAAPASKESTPAPAVVQSAAGQQSAGLAPAEPPKSWAKWGEKPDSATSVPPREPVQPRMTQQPPPVATYAAPQPPSHPSTAPPGFTGHPSFSQIPPDVQTQPRPEFPGLGQRPTSTPGRGGPPQGFGPSQQQGAGRGRGRGWGQDTPQQRPQPTPSFPPQSQPTPSFPPQPQPAPSAQPRSQPAPAASVPHVVSSEGDARKRDDSRPFKIPDKIIGKRVQAKPIKVLANYLPMTIKPLQIYRYDVSFKPDKPKKMIPKAFIAVKGKHFARSLIAFDQMKNCYSLEPLPKVSQTDRFVTQAEIMDNNGRMMKFEVSFKATGIVKLNDIIEYMKNRGTSLSPPTEAIQCVDVILRQGTLENYIKAGRQFFKRPERPINLGDGLEMWTGLFQSAIFTSRPFVNIDVAHKGFPINQPLISAMQNDFRLELNMPVEKQRGGGVEAFLTFIKNLRVMAMIGGDSSNSGQQREFICNELVDPPSRISFMMTDHATGKERQMTVADYFAREKRVNLRYPNLNCMWVGPRDKKIYYPLELLTVSYGQAMNKQLNDRQLSTMVREAATPPDQRKRKIEEVIRDMNYSRNTYFKQFGLEIQDKFLEVEAKVLAAPELDIGGPRPVLPSKGQWQANRLLKPEPLASWAIISIELDVQRCGGENIVSLLKSSGQQLGMSVSEPSKRYYGIPMRKLREVLFDALDQQIKFLVIIVPTRGRDYYHEVKKMAERDVGILTQCIKEQTAQRRMNPQTAKNILLKVNSKLMGINQALDKRSMPQCLAQGGVMVVGADVTHPSPEQTSVPSIAAVTASIDPRCFIYNIQLSIQTPKKEMIVEFEDMMVEHLKVYVKNQGGLPRKIFVFRDGVSEGQFEQVMKSELQAVHRAYARMSKSGKPEVLFLLVQKRHHTRLFHPDSRQASYNVEPGTVVDTHIVHARELDFYLVSHQAIKGTARPTRYHAVCNDGGIPHDEVEQLTYYLCHLYSRCMRAVSYPTPTYYAHLACLRARSLTHGEKFNNQDLERQPKRLNVLDKMLEFSRMFFV